MPADIGFKQCMAMKLVRLEKAGAITTAFPTARAAHALRGRCLAAAAAEASPSRAQAAVASFDDAVLGQLKALDAGQARVEAQPWFGAKCAHAHALIATPAARAAQTLPEADLQNLSKKRKLLDRVCVCAAGMTAGLGCACARALHASKAALTRKRRCP